LPIYDPYRFTLEITCGGNPERKEFEIWNMMYHDIGRSVAVGFDKKYGDLDLDKIYSKVLGIREEQDKREYERLKEKYKGA
jgi:hypothetical protein